MDLEKALKQASYKVWKELKPSCNPSHIIFPPLEEALTSLALRELSNSKCTKVKVIRMISAKEEKSEGYDFELAIGSDSLKKYIRLFIQAKKLKGHTLDSTYNSIDKKQNEQLISFSKEERGLALYAFFNHLEESQLVLKNHYNSIIDFDKKSLGITLTSAYSVSRLAKHSFTSFHNNFGYRLPPHLYHLRHYLNLFFFYTDKNRHLSVPFHELAFLNIRLAELINKLYKRKEAKKRTNLLLLLLLLTDGFGEENLIPITPISSYELIAKFTSKQDQGPETSAFNSKALIVIETSESRKG